MVNTLKPGSILETLKSVLKERANKEINECPIVITDVFFWYLHLSLSNFMKLFKVFRQLVSIKEYLGLVDW